MAVELCCRDMGIACGDVARAATADELVAAVAAPAAKDEHSLELDAALVDDALTEVGPARA